MAQQVQAGTTSNAVADSSKEPHKMRIASGGSISGYVKFALAFLDEHPHRPLILHTMPPSASAPNPPSKPSKHATSTLTPALLNSPRLISVVELIKRTYMQRLELPESRKGKERAIGIWQYTETGLLDPPERQGDEEGETALERVLSGKTQPKMTHQPYLQITLSTRPLGWDSRRGVTCQYVMIRRRRVRNKARNADADAEDEDEDVVLNKAGNQVQKPGLTADGTEKPQPIDSNDKSKPTSTKKPKPTNSTKKPKAADSTGKPESIDNTENSKPTTDAGMDSAGLGMQISREPGHAAPSDSAEKKRKSDGSQGGVAKKRPRGKRN